MRFVAALKQRSAELKVEVGEMTIFVSGDTAKVDITGRILAKQKGKTGKWTEEMTERGKNRVIIELEKKDESWIVVSSERLSHTLPKSSEDD